MISHDFTFLSPFFTNLQPILLDKFFCLALTSAPICFYLPPSLLLSFPFGLSPDLNSILNPQSPISLSGLNHNSEFFPRNKQTPEMLGD